MRLPSTSTSIAFLALLIALGGTAFAASGQLVHIADGTSASRLAKVDTSGRVNVGDGLGFMTVDGTVTSQPAPPAALVSVANHGSGSACTVIATPPAGKAWIVKRVSVNLYAGSGFGPSQFIALYADTTCSRLPFTDFTPTGLGSHAIDLGDGITIPNGGGLAVRGFNNSSMFYEVFAQGIEVRASAVPATASPATAPRNGSADAPPTAR